MSVLHEVADRAAADSPLWARALLPAARAGRARFAGRCPERHLLGVEMIYEGYLLHYGRSRLFSQADADLALLTGRLPVRRRPAARSAPRATWPRWTRWPS